MQIARKFREISRIGLQLVAIALLAQLLIQTSPQAGTGSSMSGMSGRTTGDAIGALVV